MISFHIETCFATFSFISSLKKNDRKNTISLKKTRKKKKKFTYTIYYFRLHFCYIHIQYDYLFVYFGYHERYNFVFFALLLPVKKNLSILLLFHIFFFHSVFVFCVPNAAFYIRKTLNTNRKKKVKKSFSFDII